MPPKKPKAPTPVVVDPSTITAQMAAIKAAKKAAADDPAAAEKRREEEAQKKAARERRARLDARRKRGVERRFWWGVAFWGWMLLVHCVGVGLFTSGFLLTRLVLGERSECGAPPAWGGVEARGAREGILAWDSPGTVEGGCWYPRVFSRAVVVVIDALRYDFTVPIGEEGRNGEGDGPQVYHNALSVLHEIAVGSPKNAVLRPFIADPPTATLQRLKGLTTGTLPTFVDLGSSFSGTAIEEDNLLSQLRAAGRRIVHLGDDTWDALFPGYFEGNLSRAYDSFNVWDLHTVDTGVLAHIFPLMDEGGKGEWDFLVAHFLGVDHAGHRYGPDHAAMRAKLLQMDRFVRDLVETVDEDTLLVVMGDHGMDGKGDHGGESDDEVEAALWMYSSRPVFGRTSEEAMFPPPNAKTRSVNQIDLVPTLALLLGLPIPYNNLGAPIEEAFAGTDGDAWDRLAAASQVTAAGIHRYLGSYFSARGLEGSPAATETEKLWNSAQDAVERAFSERDGMKAKPKVKYTQMLPFWSDSHEAISRYQMEALAVCKGLWARFDVKKMVIGIGIMLVGLLSLLLYVSRDIDEDPDLGINDNEDLQAAESFLELLDAGKEDEKEAPSYQTATKSFAKPALLTLAVALVPMLTVTYYFGGDISSPFERSTAMSLAAVLLTMLTGSTKTKTLVNLLPRNSWGWMSVIFTVSMSAGFAANSFTIWEDSILLFFITTFGLANVARAFRVIRDPTQRSLAVYHSLVFVVLGRVASVSKLCREEQMPHCASTYYSSSTSSTSSGWQLGIPFLIALALPSVVKGFLEQSRSYAGLAPTYIGLVFRAGLAIVGAYWVIDAADNGGWYPSLPPEALKTLSVAIARVVAALAVVAGTTAFAWTPPCVSVFTQPAHPLDPKGQTRVTILGYGNVNGARYLLLFLNVVGLCMLFTKPMGIGALGCMAWQVLCLAEMLDLNGLRAEAESIGPVMLGLLGNFYYFKTGHQAVLSSIQWDSAFVAFFEIRYPWSPLAVGINHFAGPILAVAALPLVVMWNTDPRRRGVMEATGRGLGVLIGFWATEAAATMMWAGYLRRHLMLYRVFNPRFMLAAAVLLLVDVVGMIVALAGTRTNVLAVSEVFGFAD